MPLPSFPVAGNLREILDIPTSGGDIADQVWAGAYVILASNVKDGVLVWDGKIYPRPPSIKATVDPTTGDIEIGDRQVRLLDNNPGLNVTGVQWRCDIKTSMSNTIASFWFDAPGDGSTVNLGDVVHVASTAAHPVPVPSGGVKPFANIAAFPLAGALNVLYVAQDTNLLYRWSGSAYVVVGGGAGTWADLAGKPSTFPPAVHTHTSAQITDFNEAAQDALALMLSGTSGITVTYDDANNTLTLAGAGASGLDAEAVRDAIGIAMVGVGNIGVTVNDAADTITISTTATQNSTDAALRDRTTHTGTQPQTSIDGLPAALADKVSKTGNEDIAGIKTFAAEIHIETGAQEWSAFVNGSGQFGIYDETNAKGPFRIYPNTPVDTFVLDADGMHTSTPIDLNGNKVTELGAGTVGTDGVNKAQMDAADATKLDKTTTASRLYATDGTGAQLLLAFGSAIAGSTIVQRDGAGAIRTATATDVTHAVPKAQMDTAITGAKDRAQHTGTQNAATIVDLNEAVQDIVGGFFAAGSNTVVTYDDANNTLTISASGGGGGLDAETVRDVIGAAIVGVGSVTVAYNDALDTITISTTATANSTDAQLRDRTTHTGQQPADSITETTAIKMLTAAERTKLAGIATGATANATDALLRDRSTHTGSQPSSSISDFAEAAQDAVAALLAAGTGVALSYNDAANSLTITGTITDTNTTDLEAVRDAMGVALVGVGPVTITVNDAADTITISSTATVNSTDAQLRDRTTHTGQQPSASISDLTETVQDIVAGFIVQGAGITKTYDDVANTLTLAASGGGGGNDARFQVFEVDFGVGDANPITIVHGMNTRSLAAAEVWKNGGGVSLNPSILPGQRVGFIDIQRTPGNELNAVTLKPDVPIGQGEFRLVLVGVIGTSDVTAPTVPTLAYDQVTSSGFRVTASGASDAVGVVGHHWFVNGSYVTTTPGNEYVHTGGAPNLTYSVQAKAIDRAGNESALSVAVTPTTSGVPVAFNNSSGVQTAAANQANGSSTRVVTVPVGGGTIVAWYVTTHVNGINPTTGFGSGPTAVATIGGTSYSMTKVASVSSSSGNTGTLHCFILNNAPAGSASVAMTSNSGGTWMDAVRGSAMVYTGDGSYVLRVTRTGQGSAALAAAVQAAAGNMAVLGIAHDGTYSDLSGNVRDTGGGAVNGSADYLSVTDAPGEVDGTVDFTASTSRAHAFIALELVRAA